jgi:hypothetical protein
MHKHTNNIKSLLKKISIINLNYNKIKSDITNDLDTLEKQYDITQLEQHYFLRKMLYNENIKLLTELDLLEKYYKDKTTLITPSARLCDKSTACIDNDLSNKLDKLIKEYEMYKENAIEHQQQLLDNNKLLLAEIDKLDIIIKEYDAYKENVVIQQQQLLDNNKLLLAEIDILNEKYTNIKEDYNNIVSDFDKVKTDFNTKHIHLNSLLVQQSLEVSKYKDKYDSLKIKSINTIKKLCNINNEKTETINKLLTEQGEINC